MNYKKFLAFFYVLTIMSVTACVSATPEEQPQAKPVALGEVTPIPLVEEKATPISPIATPTPQPSSSPTPTVIYQPPLCQFEPPNQGQPPEPESLIDKYVFSDPYPVLDYEVSLDILGWLPGNQRLLIARPTQDEHRIEVFNIQSSKIKEYVKGFFLGSERAVWVDSGQMVAFPSINDDGDYVLYTARGNGQIKQETTDLASLYIAPGPNSKRVTFTSRSERAKPKFFNSETSKREDIPFKEFDLPKKKTPNYPFKTYKLAWHPDKTQFIYYNDQVFYLVNSQTKDICELDLGTSGNVKQRSAISRWSSAQWSPDGRYLAIFTTVGEPIVPFIDLTIIDITTGDRKTIDIEGSGDKYTMAWATNSRDMLVMTHNPTSDYGHNVYLVDAITSNARQILQDSPFLFSGNTGLVWSSNGKMIAVNCFGPNPDDPKHLCLVDVEVK